MKALKKLMSKIVTDYLIRPSSEIEKTPQLESIESGGKSIWHKVLLGCDAVTLKNNATDWQKPMSRQEQYQIQGMSIPLFPISQQEPIESTVNMIVLFISGSNSHLFSCRQRAIECAYATKTAIQNRSKSARVLLSRFNPFGVINQVKNNNQALPYTAQALSQEDIASDYYQCAKLLLKTYENAQMVIMGHSLGGVFSKKVFKKLKDNPFLSNRVELVYSAMSLHGISDAFMYYRPSRMLKNIIPSSNRETISWIINAVNDYGFKCVQRVLKMAVDISGWKTESV